VFAIVTEELRFAGLQRLEAGFPFAQPNNCRDKKLRERVRALISQTVPPVIQDKLFDELKNQLHEVVDAPLVTLLTEAKGELDTIHIDWQQMQLPDPTVELGQFLDLFGADD